VNDLEPNAFIGHRERPSERELEQALGPAKPAWDTLIADLGSELGAGTLEWKCYSPKAGWSVCLKRGKRTIVWLAPCTGCFRAAVILGEKAVRAARESHLRARALRLIEEAPQYPEGRGIRILIRKPADIPLVKKLAAIKIAN
jgi:hypothetical protein